MNPIEIVLIILGIIIIIVSSRLVEKSQDTKERPDRKRLTEQIEFTEEERKQIKDKMKELLSAVSEEMIVRTDDELSRLSNEKIMAVGEFSDQILEKIARNHEEVVFLYNMLNDKEKELKAAVKEIDSSNNKVREIMENSKERSKEQPVKKATVQQKTGQQLKGFTPKKDSSSERQDNCEEDTTLIETGTNHNAQILDLYSKGKSVVEISKLLELGQGEVKLVIDLFRGRK